MKITKSLQQRLEDCEDHLLFLNEGHERHEQQPFRYKQMAAELRVLVCKTKSNKPLLLDLMEESGFTFMVDPYEKTPFGPRPLIRVDEFDRYVEIARRLMSGDRTAREENASLLRQVPLREFIQDGFATLLCECGQTNCVCNSQAKKWSWKKFIRGVAEQMGSAHEDTSISAGLERARTFMVSGTTPLSAIPAIARFIGEVASIVLKGGAAFLEEQVAVGKFEPRHFSVR